MEVGFEIGMSSCSRDGNLIFKSGVGKFFAWRVGWWIFLILGLRGFLVFEVVIRFCRYSVKAVIVVTEVSEYGYLLIKFYL